MKVLINQNSYISGPYITDANKEVELSDDYEDTIKIIKFGYIWKYINQDKIEQVALLTPEIIRFRRAKECFSYIDNKSTLWYSTLSESQKQELTAWYNAWLNATETKVIPIKPEWLK